MPENPFEFVNIAGARARQLLRGAVPRVEASGKAARTAAREVSEGHVQKVEPPAGEAGDDGTPAVPGSQ
ncbi:MAG: DNA-directed RNA polymerase subunit omega [Vicinamibacteraceae bacterium]|nr:DNA-directed RNA polymerase subunit omega [Vicinamibacteraceae bacterium]